MALKGQRVLSRKDVADVHMQEHHPDEYNKAKAASPFKENNTEDTRPDRPMAITSATERMHHTINDLENRLTQLRNRLTPMLSKPYADGSDGCEDKDSLPTCELAEVLNAHTERILSLHALVTNTLDRLEI